MRTRRHVTWLLIPVLAVLLVPLTWEASAQTSRSTVGLSKAAQVRAPQANQQAEFPTEQLIKNLPKMSFHAAQRLALNHGITSIRGKKLNMDKSAGERWRAGLDNSVATEGAYHENEPSVAVNPTNPSLVVAFTHHYVPSAVPSDPCRVWISYDSGETFQSWSYFDPPLATGDDFCSDPVVRFSPDGSHVYFSYLSIDNETDTSDAVVYICSGTTISGCTLTIPLPSLGQFVDKEWLDVHTFDAGGGPGVVHISATEFTTGGACNIIYNRSMTYGATWTFGSGIILASSGFCGEPFVLQGSRPIGGPDGNALVCWYNSEADGWLLGVFDIRCRRSSNYGASWEGEFTALDNRAFELPYWLCPSNLWYRWWGAMFPALAIDHLGRAHLAVTYDPTAGATTTECGNVLYRRSLAPPYTAWGTPVIVGSDASLRAQGYATVVAQRIPAVALPRIYVAYYFNTNATFVGPNGVYNVFYRRSLDGGATFGAPVRVADVNSITDDLFIGDYIDSATTARLYHVVWTDRGDKFSTADGEDDVYHDRFP